MKTLADVTQILKFDSRRSSRLNRRHLTQTCRSDLFTSGVQQDTYDDWLAVSCHLREEFDIQFMANEHRYFRERFARPGFEFLRHAARLPSLGMY